MMLGLDQYKFACEAANWHHLGQILGLQRTRGFAKINAEGFEQARESIRKVLFQNNMTERVLTLNFRSLANCLKLRFSTQAEAEIQGEATKMFGESF